MTKNELLTIRLGHKKDSQERGGWINGMTANEAWEAGRKYWVFKASRAIDCPTALILSPACEVIAEAEILGLRKEAADSDRFEVLGNLKPTGEYLGKIAPRGTSQNPIAYLKSSDF